MSDWERITGSEWDYFHAGHEETFDKITNLKSDHIESYPFLSEITSLTIKRDDTSMALTGLIVFNFNEKSHHLFMSHVYSKIEHGDPIPDFTLNFINDEHGHYRREVEVVFRCVDNRRIMPDSAMMVRLGIIVYSVNIKKNKEEPKFVKEFYINSPKFTPQRLRSLSMEQRFTETIEGRKAEIRRSDSFYKCEMGSIYHKGNEIQVYDIPKEITRGEYGCIVIKSNIETRRDKEYDIIVTYLSFLLGKRLCKVGEAHLTESGGHIELRSELPNGYHYFRTQNYTAPFRNENGNPVFDIANKYVDTFIEKYIEYNLEEIFDLYWESSKYSMITSIIHYHRTVQAMQYAYYGGKIPKALRMDKGTFNRLCEEGLEIIRVNMERENVPGCDAIMESMRNSYMQSLTKMHEDFGKKLNVIPTDEEIKMIGKANRIRHSSAVPDDEAFRIRNFYLTYVNRLIISLTGMGSEGYRDYSEGRYKPN